MKKKLLLCAVGLAVFSLSVIISLNSRKDITFIDANVEALADGEEVTEKCGQSFCGKCYYEVTAWPIRKCKWSGDVEDSCECDRPGWIG